MELLKILTWRDRCCFFRVESYLMILRDRKTCVSSTYPCVFVVDNVHATWSLRFRSSGFDVYEYSRNHWFPSPADCWWWVYSTSFIYGGFGGDGNSLLAILNPHDFLGILNDGRCRKSVGRWRSAAFGQLAGFRMTTRSLVFSCLVLRQRSLFRFPSDPAVFDFCFWSAFTRVDGIYNLVD